MFDSDSLSQAAQSAFASKHSARERALPKSRATIRHCANAIRAIHRSEFGAARRLLDDAHRLLEEMRVDLADYPDIYYAGFVEDAQKEFVEATATLAIIQRLPVAGPHELGVEWAAYLNGLGECVGELRRHLLNELRQGHFERCESILETMDEIFAVLAMLDFPDAITNNLRRTADAARGIIEKTRGDLTTAAIQVRLSAQIANLLQEMGTATAFVPPYQQEENDE